MDERKIDYDRGVIINVHAITGMDVFMYHDEPGVYLTAHGTIVPKEIAAQAGFDVEKLAKEHLKKQRKAKALEMIDADLADDKDIKEEVVSEKNGFKMISIGHGRHHVLDPDGNRLSTRPLTEQEAQSLFIGMAGDDNALAGSAGVKKK